MRLLLIIPLFWDWLDFAPSVVCYVLNSRPVRVERADRVAQMPRIACLPNLDVLRLDYFKFLTDCGYKLQFRTMSWHISDVG